MEKWGDVQIDGDNIRKAREAKSAGGQRSWRLRAGAFGAVLVFGACGAPTTAVAAEGAALQAPAPAAEVPDSWGTIEPQVCASCTPPLVYFRGPVMSTNGGAGLTVTPMWWQPSGGRYTFPAIYESLIDQYIADVAAASSSTDNIYSIDTEYYEVVGGLKTYVSYKITAGTPVVDTDAYPANGCKPAPGYHCVYHGRPVAQ